MQYVIFKGKEAKNIGRFGMVSPGDKLVLTELEFKGIHGNPEFAMDKSPAPTQEETTRVAIQNIHEKTREELLRMAEQLIKQGEKLDIPHNAPKAKLVALLEPFAVPA